MTSGRSDIIDVTVELHHQTDKAVLVSDTGNREEAVWLPKSSIEIERQPNGTYIVSAPEWLLHDKGLI